MNIAYRPILLLTALALSGSAFPAAAQTSIYRCHALNGNLVFQDRPCNTAAGTREARTDHEGEVISIAPAPVQDGTPAVERYTRYLDFVSKDRREQQAADEARAERLRAAADADRAAAERSAATACSARGPDGSCLSDGYDPPYAFFLPQPHRSYYQGPYLHPNPPYTGHAVAPAPIRRGPRPLGPNQPPAAPTRDARSEILSLAP